MLLFFKIKYCILINSIKSMPQLACIGHVGLLKNCILIQLPKNAKMELRYRQIKFVPGRRLLRAMVRHVSLSFVT